MDLKIQDVAAMLNVSETKIQSWIVDGRLPAYRIEEEWRFNRIEVEDSIMANKLTSSDSTTTSGGSLQFSLYRALHKGMVLLDVSGTSKDAVITNAVNTMAKELQLDAEVLTDLLLSREKLHSTAVGHGIALPHTRDFLLSSNQDVVVIAFPKNPIPYEALDGEAVNTLFFLFACSDKRHLHLLAKLAHLSNDENARKLLQSKPNKETLLSFIRDWEANLRPKA